ncbi:MAG TPA: hypothetical protein VM597_20605 [Gemmataceae bacterium]|nr:hypothetical protein [Gemmataceae bacterium]
MLGKIMVVVFTALSLAVFTWAFGVYTQRIEFSAPAGKDTPGIFKTQQAKAAELSANADRAFTRWSGNLATITNVEGQRYPRRSYYAALLQLGEYGLIWNAQARQWAPAPAGVPMFQVLAITKDGYIDVSPGPRQPVLSREGGAPLRSLANYAQDAVKLAQDIRTSREANVKWIDERKKLNDEIVGVTEPQLVKGLRRLISEQKTIDEQANMEDVYAADVVTNREAEFGLLKKRRDAMTARMEELDRDPERKFVPPTKKDPNRAGN